MKLLLRRSQPQNMLGVNTFELTARAELNEEELVLVDQCNMANETLYLLEKEKPDDKSVNVAWAKYENKRLSVGKLITGYTFRCDYITDILEIEELIKEASIQLQKYLDIAATYGGEETIDIRKLVDQEEV